MGASTHPQVSRNISIHDRIARDYDMRHGEIFNAIEQERIRSLLERALAAVETGRRLARALDFGCGSGNLTRHLLELGAEVTAADVSTGCLGLVEERYGSARLRTFHLNGIELGGLADGEFDLAATYSVLHHIPDYLGACAELARVTAPGGVVVIDHESSPGAWLGDPVYDEFWRAARKRDWRKYLNPLNYVRGAWRRLNPPDYDEGDIHVWPDDHVEWDKVGAVMEANGMEVVLEEDYLLNRSAFRPDVYELYRDRCSDMRVTVFRKTRR